MALQQQSPSEKPGSLPLANSETELDHTGGTGDAFTPAYFAHRLETRSLADYVRLLGDRPVRFDPGTRMEYSNYGYILLGRLIERTTGEAYDSYIQQHIFAPVGMSHTDLGHEAVRGEERAVGYMRISLWPGLMACIHGPSNERAIGSMRSGHSLIPNTPILPWAGTSAGGEYSTAHDLLQFASALQSGRLLNRALLRKATTDQAHYGYGLGFDLLGESSFGHIGGMPGISSELLILPRSGYVLIVLANRDPKMADNMVWFIRQSSPQPPTESCACIAPHPEITS